MNDVSNDAEVGAIDLEEAQEQARAEKARETAAVSPAPSESAS